MAANDIKEKIVMKHMTAVLVAVAMLAPQSVLAQDKIATMTDMEALRAAVRADKKAYVASILGLTDAEAKKFWPIYSVYQGKLDMATRQRNVALEGLIGASKPLSDAYARNLATETIAADEIEIKARRTLHNRVMKALPGRKAARYLQLESKIRAALAYDVAVAIPLAE